MGSKDIDDIKWAVDYGPSFKSLQIFQLWPESENFCRNLSHKIYECNRFCLTKYMIQNENGSEISLL